MPVNPITGVVTYTLDEWREESQLWERDGALRERERIIKLLLTIQQNWERKPALNFKAELFELIKLIEETK